MKKLFAIFLTFHLMIFPLCALSAETAEGVEKTNAIVNSLNEFAFDLYRQIGIHDENIIISPYSLSSALTMLLTGSAGTTQTELMTALHFTTSQDIKNINDELNWLNASFVPYHPCKGWFSCKIVTLREWIGSAETNDNFAIANAIWANKNFTYKPAFIIETKKNPFVHFKNVDFNEHPEEARLKINQWIADRTNHYINQLLPPNSVTKETLLILTNAIYFKGIWELQFEKNETQDLPFTLASGKQEQVQMMHQTDDFLITENDFLQMLQLHYKDSPLAMAILLPKTHTLQELLPRLTNSLFQDLLKSAIKRKVTVSLPRFKLESTFSSLTNELQTLGLHDTLSDHADFSNMSEEKLLISQVIQKAIIEVNEEGTVAAAATGVVMLTSAQLPLIFNANHPFIFIIYDTNTKTIFFMGQVTKPLS